MQPRRVLTLLALLTGLVSSACAGAGTPAATVNGVDISRSEVNDLIDHVTEVAGADPALAADLVPSTGVFNAEISSALVSFLIQRTAYRTVAEENGITLTEDELASVADLQQQQADQAAALAEEQGAEPAPTFTQVDEIFVELQAYDNRFLQEGVVIEGVTVSVDPRYGQWDEATSQLIPPALVPAQG